MTLTRPRLILLALLLTIGVSAVWWGPWVWGVTLYRETPFLDFHGTVGLRREIRSTDAIVGVRLWSLDTGLMQAALEYDARDVGTYTIHEYPAVRRSVEWADCGMLVAQCAEMDVRNEPPWIWETGNQTEPTLPQWLREWAEDEIRRREAEGK